MKGANGKTWAQNHPTAAQVIATVDRACEIHSLPTWTELRNALDAMMVATDNAATEHDTLMNQAYLKTVARPRAEEALRKVPR